MENPRRARHSRAAISCAASPSPRRARVLPYVLVAVACGPSPRPAAADAAVSSTATVAARSPPRSPRAGGPRAAALASAADSPARRVRASRAGIAVEAPPGWTLAQRTGFSETLFTLSFPDRSRISISAERTRAISGAVLVRENSRVLEAQGFAVIGSAAGPGAWRSLDLEAPGRRERLRQLYLVRPVDKESQVVVLTLVCVASAFETHVPALAFVVDRMTFEDSPPTSAPTSDRAFEGRSRSSAPAARSTSRAGATVVAEPGSRGRGGIDAIDRDAGFEDACER